MQQAIGIAGGEGGGGFRLVLTNLPGQRIPEFGGNKDALWLCLT